MDNANLQGKMFGPQDEYAPPALLMPPAMSGSPGRGPVSGAKPRYVDALRRHPFLLLAGTLVGAAVGVFLLLLSIPTYSGSATVDVVGVNGNFMQMREVDPELNSTGGVIDLQEQFRIIGSSTLLRRAAERLTLETPPVNPPSSGVVSKLRTRFGLLPSTPAEFTRTAIRKAISSVTLKPLGSQHVFAITCTSTSAEIAAAAANTIAAEYMAQTQQFRASTATRTAEWLAGQVQEAKSQAEEADAKLQAFMKAQGIKFVLDQNTLDDSKLRQLQASLATMQSDRIEKESRYNLAKSNPSDSLPEILDDATITGLKTHLTQLRQERAVLLATLTPEHYKVRRVDAEIAETEASIRTQKANVVKRIQNEYEAALERERRTASAYQAQSHVLANQSDESLQYEALKQAVASARAYYNQILSQYNTALRVSAVPVENVRLIDPAQPLNVPQSPKPLTDVIGGTIAGFFFAALLVLGFEHLRNLRVSRTFHAPGHASALLEVPELGVIPRLEVGRRKKPLLLTDGSQNPNSIAPGPSRIAAWEAEPFVAEPFRLVVASLFARKLDRGHSAILISSAAPEEGKTTVASHTAVVMAQAGRRVLLVDADVRRPRLYKLFSLPKERGIGELLAGDTPVTPNTLADRIIPSPIHGLSLLPAGIVSDEAIGRIFFSDALQAAVDHLRHMFDIVIIDSAPALSFSDARRIGRACDGVILVLRAEKTSRESARATAASLIGDGIPVLGAVLNDFMPDQTSPYTDVYSTYRKYAAARDGNA